MNSLLEANKPTVTQSIVVYGGRFQPFHRGHFDAYNRLCSKFGKQNVYIATSNDTSSDKSPFTFKEKKEIATKMFGIPASKFVRVNNPYRPVEILSKYDGKITQYIAAVGEKDADRLKSGYFKPYKGKAGYGYDEVGYFYAAPAEENPISGSDVRKKLGSASKEVAKKFFLKAYPTFDKDIFKMITGKLNEEGFPGGIGVGLDLPGGYINGAPTGSNESITEPYDPISEIIASTITTEMFNEWLSEYLDEAPNKALDQDITYTNSQGKQKKIKARDALRLPKDHPAHIQAAKIAGPDDAPANEPKPKAEPGKAAQAAAKPAQPGQPIKKGQTVQGKTDTAKPTNQPGQEQGPPPEQKLSGAELHSSAEKSAEKEKNGETKKGYVDRIGEKVKNWSEEEKQFFKDKVHKGGSPERRSWGKAIMDKAKGAGHAIMHGLQHEVKEFKAAGHGVMKLMNGKKLDDHDKKAMLSVGKKIAITGLMAAAGGGLAHGAAAFAKHVAIELVPHAIGEVVLGGVGKAAMFAEGVNEATALNIFAAAIAERLENMDIKPDVMESIIDSYNNKKLINKFSINESKEYIIWGVPPNERDEVVAFTKAKSMPEAKKVMDILKNKHGLTKLRVQIIDLDQTFDLNKAFKGTIKENLSETKQQSIQHFVEFASKRLKLKETPKVNLVGGREFAEVKTSLGGFDPVSKEIFVATEGRLTADILRTLAHEMVHRKQDEMGYIKDSVNDGADGSPIENQAHAVAGILMREYGRINKQIYNEGFVNSAQQEMVKNLIKAKDNFETALKYTKSAQEKNVIVKQLKDIDKLIKGLVSAKSLSEIQSILDNISIDVDKGDTVLMGKFKNKKTIIKKIGTDDHGMPTINGRQATTFRKGPNVFDKKDENIDEMNSTDIHFKNIVRYFDKGGPNIKKQVSTVIAGNNRSNRNEIVSNLRNAGYEEIVEWEKELGIEDLFESKIIKENLLLEGGAYGHMAHPFDDMDLTFGDLKNIITGALNGELGVVREKTDGQALAISWKNGRLIAARNKGHLANAGANALGIEGVASKFGGRGGLTDAYNFAMKDLSAAISSLSQKQRDKIFGEGTKFMNLEVIWPTSVNVIPYGQALLVFHNCIEYDTSGSAIGKVDGAESILAGMIKQVNADVQSKYTIQGPPITSIPKDDNLSSKQGKYISKLKKLQSEFGCSDSDTLALYHQHWWENFVSESGEKLLKLEKEALVRRWAFGDKSFRLNTITDKDAQAWSIEHDKVNVAKQQKDNIKPFEEIFLGVGADILEFVGSVLTVHPEKAIRSMKEKFKSVANQVRGGGDVSKIQKLKTELERLNGLGGIEKIVASEGLVFVYGGKTYKLTGTFAPLNQILGIFYS